MKKLSFLFAVLSVCFYTNQASADFPWNSNNLWHLKSQQERNQLIINRAQQDTGMWVGKSCKDWVKDVVSSASSGHISLPSTESAPYDYIWSESSDPFYHVVGMSMPIKYVATGHIIQMRLKNGCPHTAIVLSNNGTSITFIESNWDSTPYNNNDAYVKVRPPITYQQFYSQLQSSGSFTVYYIQ